MMNKVDFEKLIFDFLKKGLLPVALYTSPLIIILPLILMKLSQSYISTIPHRYPVRTVVKMGFLKKPRFKSSIIEKESEKRILNIELETFGLSKTDLEILLQTTFINHRGKGKSMFDAGPFITNIKFQENSNLIVIEGEAQDKEKGKSHLNEVTAFLKKMFNDNKDTYIKVINDRRLMLEKDLNKNNKELRHFQAIEKRYGYTPILAKQIQELNTKKMKLKYMLADIKFQLNEDNINEFEVLSQTKGVYPVTKRKAIYYAIIGVISEILYILIVLVASIVKFKGHPIPRKNIEGELANA